MKTKATSSFPYQLKKTYIVIICQKGKYFLQYYLSVNLFNWQLTLAAQTLQQQICPHGRNKVSRLASEQTRHSSAVGSFCGTSTLAGASAVDVDGTAAIEKDPDSLSGVVSLILMPSLRQVVNVLRRFGSGHRSNGV